MEKIIAAAKNLGAYRELEKGIIDGRFSETMEEKEARKTSMDACLKIIGGQYSFPEIQEAIREGRAEFRAEFPNAYR